MYTFKLTSKFVRSESLIDIELVPLIFKYVHTLFSTKDQHEELQLSICLNNIVTNRVQYH